LISYSFYFIESFDFIDYSKNERKALPSEFLKNEPRPEEVCLLALG
jgi:hypothetical protein